MRNVQAQIRKKIFDQSFLVRDTENNAIITFEVHTRFAKTAGGDKQANFISDNLMDQIITRGNAPWFSATTGFKIYSVELDNINFFQEQRSDGYYVRSVIDINFKTMEN